MLPVQWHSININDLVAFAAVNASQEMHEHDSKEDELTEEEVARKLADQLRDMIRDGISDECSICLCEFDLPVITPCGHVYCRPCIVQHIEGVTTPPAACPLCRRQITTNKLLEAAPEEEEESAACNIDPFEDIVVDISSTKVNAMLKEIKGLERDFPHEKIVVVSQFTKLLSIIQVSHCK